MNHKSTPRCDRLFASLRSQAETEASFSDADAISIVRRAAKSPQRAGVMALLKGILKRGPALRLVLPTAFVFTGLLTVLLLLPVFSPFFLNEVDQAEARYLENLLSYSSASSTLPRSPWETSPADETDWMEDDLAWIRSAAPSHRDVFDFNLVE